MVKRIFSGIVLAATLTTGTAIAADNAKGVVNINTASAQELQLLPRVGPALAKRIVDFRATNGNFKAPQELTRVKGIGEKSFANLQEYVTVSGTTTLKEKVRLSRGGRVKAPQA
jgi:competence protein ComEA